MPGDPLLSRRVALKLTAVGGAGLVAAACTGGTDPATPKLDVGTTPPERPPLPGRPRNVRVSQDEFVAPIRVISSTDRGATWGRPVELGKGVMEVRVRPDTNGLGLPTVVAHRSRPLAAAAFLVRRPGASFADIAVCLSRDRGRTWTPPRPVPRASDDTSYLQPQLAMDEAGRLALSAFAYRQAQIEVVVLVAEPASARFGRPRPVTSRPFDPARGTLSGKHGAWWIGDYQGLAIAAGGIHPFWNDPRTGRLEIFTAAVPGGAG